MHDVTFEKLLGLYRSIQFEGPMRVDGWHGMLTISSQDDLDFIKFIDQDDAADEDAGVYLADDADRMEVGQVVSVRVQHPRGSLGVLAEDFSQFLKSPNAVFDEPEHYFIIESGAYRDQQPPHVSIASYRMALEVGKILVEAASYVDKTMVELVFFQNEKVVVPIGLAPEVVNSLEHSVAQKFIGLFSDPLHRERKLEIAATAVVKFSGSIRPARRFAYVFKNLDLIADEVEKGYSIFCSSFSYSKIRSELENTRLDYLGRIHKTIFDIQGQLLGIPAATIIVATQFKTPEKCGIEAWGNIAVLLAAFVFVLLLTAAVWNQWLTLTSIKSDISRQINKVKDEYAIVSSDFENMFSALLNRVGHHYLILGAVEVVSVIGLLLAAAGYFHYGWPFLAACLKSS